MAGGKDEQKRLRRSRAGMAGIGRRTLLALVTSKLGHRVSIPRDSARLSSSVMSLG